MWLNIRSMVTLVWMCFFPSVSCVCFYLPPGFLTSWKLENTPRPWFRRTKKCITKWLRSCGWIFYLVCCHFNVTLLRNSLCFDAMFEVLALSFCCLSLEILQEKRFHNWLENARDWAVSRSRFWGTPLPIWISEDGEEVVVMDSIAKLEKLSGVKVWSLTLSHSQCCVWFFLVLFKKSNILLETSTYIWMYVLDISLNCICSEILNLRNSA